GLPVLLGIERPVHETFIQTAGHGWRITTEKLKAAMEQSPSVHRILLRYVHALVTQMAYTSLANGRYKIEERLARWLLMVYDRADGVTNGLSDFQKRGILRAARGTITILNRRALEEAANGSYGIPEAEYDRLFG